jgi:hypothetical protein
MFEPGSRSKQTTTFMLPTDVDLFSDAVAPLVDGLARWQTHDQHRRTIELHNSLAAAMRHDRVQAFLRLLDHDGLTVGPIIQYLHTSVWTTDPEVLAATGGRSRPVAPRPEEMLPGRLAFKWFPGKQAECIQREIVELVSRAWKALNTVTSPHLTTAAGKPMRNHRIGPAAKGWLQQDQARVIRDYSLELRLRD